MNDFSDFSLGECENLGVKTPGGVHRIVWSEYPRHSISADLTWSDWRKVKKIFERPDVQEALKDPKTAKQLKRYYWDALLNVGI